MNARRKRRLLGVFLKLVEDGELDYAYWDELCEKLEIQASRGNPEVSEFLQKIRRLSETSQIRQGQVIAVREVLREFLVQVLAEISVRLVKGY